MVDDTTRLLGLDGLAVARAVDGPDGLIAYSVTADEQVRGRRGRKGNRE